MSIDSAPIVSPPQLPQARKPRARLAVTNHKDLLPNLDGRRAEARRFRDLVLAFVADMGGLDCCSEIKLGLLRRLAAATVQAELLEARMVNGEQIDIPTLCTLASTTVRLATRLGLERRAKPVETLASILARMEPEGEPEPKQPADEVTP
jgi:hypothetical protein